LAAFIAGRQASAPSPSSGLAGTSWQLVKFQDSDDTTLTPTTARSTRSNSLTARVDCNRGGGIWKSSSASQIAFGPLALTRAKCPAGSLHDQIVKQWANIRSYVDRDGHLFLALMSDGGIYEFEPAAKRSGLIQRAIELLDVRGPALHRLARRHGRWCDVGQAVNGGEVTDCSERERSHSKNFGPNFGPITPKHHGKPRSTRDQQSKTNQPDREPREICKTSIPGSNPGGASIFRRKFVRLFVRGTIRRAKTVSNCHPLTLARGPKSLTRCDLPDGRRGRAEVFWTSSSSVAQST